MEGKHSEVSSIVSSKGAFFWRSGPVVEYAAKSIYFEYREGTERAVRETIKNDMFEMAKNLGWGKSDVTFFLMKIEGHPKLDDGYAYEIQLNGDGGSYLEKVLLALRATDVHQVWIECSKQFAFIDCKLSQLETSLSHLRPESSDIVVSSKDKPQKMKPLYVENYAFFYVSVMLFIVSAFSIPVAAMFKYVWLNQEKHIEDVYHYVPSRYVPINVLKNERSTEDFRVAAVRYAPSKGWFIIKEVERDGLLIQYEQNIDSAGELSEPVKVSETPIVQESEDGVVIEEGDTNVSE